MITILAIQLRNSAGILNHSSVFNCCVAIKSLICCYLKAFLLLDLNHNSFSDFRNFGDQPFLATGLMQFTPDHSHFEEAEPKEQECKVVIPYFGSFGTVFCLFGYY